MLNLNINPVFLDLGFVQIRYYGLIFIAGFLIGLLGLFNAVKKGKIDLDRNKIYDLIFYLFLGILVGARIFHVLFWGLDYYANNLLKIFFIC